MPVDNPVLAPPTPSLFRYSEPVVEVMAGGKPLHFAVAGDHALAGWLPEDLRGAEALVVADGPVVVETLPDDGGERWIVQARLKASVATGEIRGEVVIEGAGESTADLRRFLPRIPKAQRKQVVERALAPVIAGLTVESFKISDLEDVDQPCRIELSVVIPEGLKRVPGGLRLSRLFAVPVSSVLGRGVAPGRYLQRAERKQTLMTQPLREALDVAVEFDQPVRLARSHEALHSSTSWGTLAQAWVADSPTAVRLSRTLDIGIRRVVVADHGGFADAMAAADRALSDEVLFVVTP